VVISTQHSPEVTLKQIREDIIDTSSFRSSQGAREPREDHLSHQPHGRFVIGDRTGTRASRPQDHRDTMEAWAARRRCLFGKTDESGPLRLVHGRYIAKNLVAAGLCEKCEVQLAYAIGVAEPVSVMVDSSARAASGRGDAEAGAQALELTPAASSSRSTCAGHLPQDGATAISGVPTRISPGRRDKATR